MTASVAAVRSSGLLDSFRRSFREGPGLVVWPVAAAGVVVFGLAVSAGVGWLAGPAVALLIAATLAEAFPIPIERVAAGATSFANVFIVSAAVLYGWRVGVLVGAGAMLLVELHLGRRPLRLLYNSALYALGGAAAGGVAAVVPQLGLASSLAFYLVNVALLSAVVARLRSELYPLVAVGFYRSTFVPFSVMTATTAILIELWQRSPFYALLLAAPLILIIAYQRSLTEALQRQRELDALKDEFIAVISHELRTPLASVYGSAATLERPNLGAETREQLLAIVRRESGRLAKLVDDVLWASRLNPNRLRDAPDRCPITPLLQEVVSSIAEIAPDNVQLRLNNGCGSSSLRVDDEQLRRILLNLVENAVKYSPDGGTVELAAQCVDGRLRFTVSDEGIGIAAEAREQIFEKFTRLDPQMRRGIGGTGLGLYICRELVHQMGGRIWVTSNKPRGSTFAFELPIS